MRTFTIIWLGQLLSTIGSYMSGFALSIWAWQLTQSATALALVGLFSQLPGIPMTLFAGIIADRFNRKRLMMLGDAIAAVSTLAILSLYLTDNLQIWHLYLISAIKGGFGRMALK
jgi:MFS family permease